jgi:hypothetical protein
MSFPFQSDPTRLEKQAKTERDNLAKAITIDQFLANIGNQSINDLKSRYTAPGNAALDFGFIKLDRPSYTADNFRYVKDPRYPGKFIDMNHFLGNADLNSSKANDLGILVELQQLLKGYPSAFTESDIRSNGLGTIFGTDYHKSDEKDLPLKDDLIKFFDDYSKGAGTPRSEYRPPAYAREPLGPFNNPPPPPGCPLVLDLDGDGVELTTLAEQVVRFDMDMDGMGEATGWVKADDGLLVLDRNGDGVINDLSELFGTQVVTDSGFKRLQPLDTSGDGWISAADTDFAALQVWRDLDQNGMSSFDELFSLSQLGIARIKTTYTTIAQPVPGQNTIVDVSTYERTDGTQQQIVDVWFALDQLNSRFDFRSTVNSSLTITEEIFDLPTLQGYGNLPDLTIAMAQDSQLLNLVRTFTQQMQQGNYTSIESTIQTILYQWAGVSGIVPDRGPYVDSRKLAFLEKFLGQTFLQGNPQWSQAGVALNTAFDNLVIPLARRLTAQTIRGSVTYDALSDRLTYKGTVAEATTLFLQRVDDTTPQGQLDASLLSQFLKEEGINVIDGGVGNDSLNGLSGNDVIAGKAGNDTINAGSGDDSIAGQEGNDILYGNSGNDFLRGGSGNDMLFGHDDNDNLSGGDGSDYLDAGAGNDTLNGGDGDDALVIDSIGTDAVDGGTGEDQLGMYQSSGTSAINISYTSVTGGNIQNVEAFYIQTGSGNDNLNISAAQGSPGRWGNNIVYAGSGNDTVVGSSGADILYGEDGDDALDGGANNDSLQGGNGSDSLIGGSGNDSLNGGIGNDTRLGRRRI